MGASQHPVLSIGTRMLEDVRVWVGGLILLSPALVLGLAWARRGRYYSSKPADRRHKILYLVALVAASVSTLGYLAYWGWRVCRLYEITFPFIALLTLERFVHGCRLLSAVAIAFLIIGRGPYRAILALAILWVMLHFGGMVTSFTGPREY